MAQGLHSEKMWEELAEDPFRGLRAGPATFSPFLFLPVIRARTGFLKLLQLVANSSVAHQRGCALNEQNAKKHKKRETHLVVGEILDG
jgi:hypothetical protein